MEEWRNNDINIEDWIEKREDDMQRQEDEDKIKKAKYNRIYIEIGTGCRKPNYLKRENSGRKVKGMRLGH